MSVIGVVTASVIAVTIPSAYYIIKLAEINQVHNLEASFLAKNIESIIQARPDMWEYESIRLKEILSRPSISTEEDEREVRTEAGKLISKNDYTAVTPTVSYSTPIFDSGRSVGSIIIRSSIRSQLINTVLLGIFSSFLGTLIFYIFRIYPLRKLENTLRDLQRERDKSEKTLYAIGDGVIVVDQQNNIRFINRAAESLIGINRFEAVGHQLEEVYLLRQGKENKIGEKEYTLTTRVGNEYAVEEVRTSFDDMAPDSGGVVIVFRDITERKLLREEFYKLEQQFHQAQKLESLGVLAGGIAHDFNNILAIIQGYCGLIRMDYTTTEYDIIQIERAVERAAELCSQMLAYAGKAQFAKSLVDMPTMVEEIASMLRSTLPQNAVIKLDICRNIPSVVGDASQLRQVVMNLIINASEAIGNGQGEVLVVLAKTTLVSGKTYKDYNGKAIPPGTYVSLEVTDNGCGMDDDTKWRIFEPFYTTKFTGRGLGMSAVLGIISSHYGALQLFSQLGEGTTFKVFLPAEISDAMEHEEQIQPALSAPWRGNGTILVVEDEEQVLLIVATILKNRGFTVITATNGLEALELYQKHADDILLVVTDIGMPIMDGYELFRELKKLRPELPIIISSGFGETVVTARINREDIAGFISKPYKFDQLWEVLKSVVDKLADHHPDDGPL